MTSVLAVDFGEKRLGFAISDPGRIISMPLRTVEVKSFTDALQATLKVCDEKKAGLLIVGMPFNMDGTKGAQAEKVGVFTAKLQAALEIPVDTWDERLSSKQIERMLIEKDVSRARRKQIVDKLSAQVFLQAYLDAHEFAVKTP